MQLSGSIALSVRGECAFTAKAEVAQAGGAAALVLINDKEGLDFVFNPLTVFSCCYFLLCGSCFDEPLTSVSLSLLF